MKTRNIQNVPIHLNCNDIVDVKGSAIENTEPKQPKMVLNT